MNSKNQIAITIFFIVAFFTIVVIPKTVEASLASLTAGATYITADGDVFGMNDTKISVKSTKPNDYKGALSSGCYSCRTGSQWKDGVRQEYYPNDAIATKNTITTGQQWGISFDANAPKYTWGCGNSDCPSGDLGDCNFFAITMTRPSSAMFDNGYWVGREWGYTDVGSTGGLKMESRTDSYTYNITLNNGGRTFLRLDYRLNRKPTAHLVSSAYGTDTDGSYTIPSGQTAIPIVLTGKFGELDPETGSIQIMYKKSTDANWTSFGTNNGAEDPNGSYTARANNINTSLSPWGWKTPNTAKNTNIPFPAVSLGSGTYSWAVRAIDQYQNYSGSWSAVGTFVISAAEQTSACLCSAEPEATNCVEGSTDMVHNSLLCSFPATSTLGCSVAPESGLAPLVVSVTTTSTELSPLLFDYDMNSDGTYEYSGRPNIVYYTYSNPGTYTITVRHPDSGKTATCSPSPISVENPTDSDGGEVAP